MTRSRPKETHYAHKPNTETTFLACLKVTTLFVFGFFDMIMTPAYIAAGEPLLKTAGGAFSLTPSPAPAAVQFT